MSLINDALKRAKQAPPRIAPNSLPPLQPVAEESSFVPPWLIPLVIIILIFAAIFFIGWSVAHRTVRSIVAAPDLTTTQEVATVPLPAAVPPPEPPTPVKPPTRVDPPTLPRLQGIFYSPTAPSAIVDGKTIRPGDKFQQYQVKEITKSTVTLIAPDGRAIKLGMRN